MEMNLNNIFDQFIPIKIISIPLSIIGTIIALSWILLINNTLWTPNRTNLTNILLENVFNNLLPTNQNNNWHPWIFSTFLLCLTFNILSLIPYTFSQTSHLSITFSLSWPIWLSFQITGLLQNWKAKLSHLVPNGTPVFLIPIMIIIETLSLLIQPLTLGFRLGANLLAGHLLIFLCSCVIWNLVSNNILGIASFTLLILLFILEIAVACIQAGVFLILSNNYLNENLN
uniref:ATP synthase subunit a n=1 Tax=Ophiarachnella gorgonia TaxID=1365872 RepID=A0A6C0FFS0_9ECHI|nr:ATP synthase F0 subunit 6 [Ophiarachnella gorgonia]QHT54251.1 ATP synthase F0 subunit 6 [Ophiarachnella gorgonia]